MKTWIACVAIGLIGLNCAALAWSVADVAPAPQPPFTDAKAPESALIGGVPYISYAEAIRLDHAEKPVANPSLPASVGMVLRYWGQSTKLLKRFDAMMPEKGGWAATRWYDARGLDELKPLLDRGEPVVVLPALTPDAHPFYMFDQLYLTLGGKAAAVLGDLEAPGSGVRGRMSSFEVFRKYRAEVEPNGPNPMREIAALACRVLIGYDDKRKVVTLHDPAFGPAREVSYEDFERMWVANNHCCITFAPRAGEDKRKAGVQVPYRPLTTDEQAAWPYTQGYALLNIGRPAEAVERLRQAAATAGIGKGRKALVLLELGLALHECGQNEAAAAALEEATAALPELPIAWNALAHVYKSGTLEGWERKGAGAQAKAEELAKDRKAMKRAIDALPNAPY